MGCCVGVVPGGAHEGLGCEVVDVVEFHADEGRAVTQVGYVAQVEADAACDAQGM